VSKVNKQFLLASMAAVVLGVSLLAAAAGGPATAAPAARGDQAQATQAGQVPPGFGSGPAAVLAQMSEQQRVGQLFMAGVPATGPVSSAISTDISTYHTGSVILTGDSSAGVTATLQLTNQLQNLATSAATDSVPLFISTNQEGGNVQSLTGPGFSTMPTALSQGSEPTAELESNAYDWGTQLAAAGVNLNLAPVLDTVPEDLASTNQPIGIYQREYGYTPAAVTASGTAFIQGMHEAGVSTAIKHFPGLGRASGNTDTTYGVTDDVTTFDDPYLQPYATAVQSYGAQVVMVSECIYTLIDPSHQAVFSPTVIGGMLRGELGFNGMIMSDSMEATAVDELTPAEQALDFLEAGGDLVLATDPTVIPAMYDAVLAQAQSDPAFATLVDQAALTVLIAKQQTGLLNPSGGVLGDVTGNGKPDMLAINPGGNLYLYPDTGGTGTATFGAPSQVGSGWTGYTLAAVGDVHGSGRAGILAVDPNGNLLYYPSTGGASAPAFGAATRVGSGWTGGYTVAGLVDLYSASRPGILAVDPNGNLLYYPNTGGTGTATFGAPTQVGSGWTGYTVDPADFNGDGKPDLLAINSAGNMYLYLNTGGTGTATFGTPTQVGSGWSHYEAADAAFISGASGADVLAIDPSGTLYLYPNTGGTGTATFGSRTQVGSDWTGYTMN
jgi:beta-glucosidase-like glycosyl hydrolase